MFDVSVTLRQDGPNESGHDETLPTLEVAIQWIERATFGFGPMYRAWINGKEVRVTFGKLFDKDNNPLAEADLMKPAKSMADHVCNLALRGKYSQFLSDHTNPPLSFEDWKKEKLRPVATNPATREAGAA